MSVSTPPATRRSRVNEQEDGLSAMRNLHCQLDEEAIPKGTRHPVIIKRRDNRAKSFGVGGTGNDVVNHPHGLNLEAFMPAQRDTKGRFGGGVVSSADSALVSRLPYQIFRLLANEP
jgi:hypothetical protein